MSTAIERKDWIRRQQIVAPRGRYLEPTVGQRMRRMSAMERAEVQAIMRSMSLRHAVRQILYIHFHRLHEIPRDTSIQRLRAVALEHESNAKLQRDFNEQRTPFELHVVNSERKPLIIAPTRQEKDDASVLAHASRAPSP